ncbi:type IV pilus biogenesis protein PilM [Bacillus sp. T33-2]|uniref:type IV pilus biogenesis protein PilM n=1 Tax=Bacillus sp. T33-2 TaxID=2054168 RepID=UPI000C77FDE5|nr:pilus assembly protein PilM [Bacillus sp. T33-2]PLR93713.1 pilus assembly protein PilM [Bacillus sp. T33-2]
MALSLFSGRSRVINIVINDHSIRYVEMKQKNPPVPLHFGERFLPAGIISDGKIQDFDTLANILDECIDDWKIAKREVRFTVPDSLVIIRKVSIPEDVKEDEIHGYLYLELGSSIHLPFDEPVFDTVSLSLGNGKKEILLFAAPEKYVMEYSDLFKTVRLKPLAADISPLAIYRLYHQSGMAKPNERLLSIQFDLRLVSMCIFEGNIPVFMRHIPVELSKDWDVSLGTSGTQELTFYGEMNELIFHFEDIYKEINKLMDFYRYTLTQGKKEVTRILLNGDHPMLDRIFGEMNERFDLPVDMLETSMPTGSGVELPRAFHLPLGLGLKEV